MVDLNGSPSIYCSIGIDPDHLQIYGLSIYHFMLENFLLRLGLVLTRLVTCKTQVDN